MSVHLPKNKIILRQREWRQAYRTFERAVKAAAELSDSQSNTAYTESELRNYLLEISETLEGLQQSFTSSNKAAEALANAIVLKFGFWNAAEYERICGEDHSDLVGQRFSLTHELEQLKTDVSELLASMEAKNRQPVIPTAPPPTIPIIDVQQMTDKIISEITSILINYQKEVSTKPKLTVQFPERDYSCTNLASSSLSDPWKINNDVDPISTTELSTVTTVVKLSPGLEGNFAWSPKSKKSN